MAINWETKERKLIRYPVYLSWAAMLLAMSIVVVDVGGRYVFNRRLPAAEMSELLLPCIIFPSLAYALAAGSHTRVTLVTDHFPRLARLWLDVAAYAIGAAFSEFMTYFGWQLFLASWLTKEEVTVAINLPWWLFKLSFPAGAALFCLQFLVQLAFIVARLTSAKKA